MAFSKNDSWLMEFGDAQRAADSIMELLHERTVIMEEGGADAARMTGAIRRKITGLRTKCDGLESLLSDQNVYVPRFSCRREDNLCLSLCKAACTAENSRN